MKVIMTHIEGRIKVLEQKQKVLINRDSTPSQESHDNSSYILLLALLSELETLKRLIIKEYNESTR